MGSGGYKEVILRFSKPAATLSGRATPRVAAAGPIQPPSHRAASFLEDFSEGHTAMDLRDPDLHLIPDFRPWDEHDEVLDPRESIALASDVLDLGFVDLSFLDRHVRRSEARARIRHSPLHAATPRRRPRSHRGVRYITI